jgi:MYXO-CTERM domain-containing protein
MTTAAAAAAADADAAAAVLSVAATAVAAFTSSAHVVRVFAQQLLQAQTGSPARCLSRRRADDGTKTITSNAATATATATAAAAAAAAVAAVAVRRRRRRILICSITTATRASDILRFARFVRNSQLLHQASHSLRRRPAGL